jgi:hypothetical protein
MRKTSILIPIAAAFAALAFADTWDGSLVDASCYDQQKSVNACYPTNTTVSFGLSVERRVFKLDQDGNTKVAKALASQAQRSDNPDPTPNAKLVATIVGSLDGNGFIKVDSVAIR